MERKEFMKSIGQGAALTLTFSCLSGCLEAENGMADQALIPDANGVLFSIDLNSSEGQTLKSPGDYIIKTDNKELTINTQIIEPNSLAELNAELEKLNVEWN